MKAACRVGTALAVSKTQLLTRVVTYEMSNTVRGVSRRSLCCLSGSSMPNSSFFTSYKRSMSCERRSEAGVMGVRWTAEPSSGVSSPSACAVATSAAPTIAQAAHEPLAVGRPTPRGEGPSGPRTGGGEAWPNSGLAVYRPAGLAGR